MVRLFRNIILAASVKKGSIILCEREGWLEQEIVGWQLKGMGSNQTRSHSEMESQGCGMSEREKVRACGV